RKVSRNEQQDAERQKQLDADQKHADAHSSFHRNVIAGVWLACEARERGARVREGIDPDSEPRHRKASGYSNQTENQNNGDSIELEVLQKTEIEDDCRPDKYFEDQQELSLREEVGFTCLVNE